ncbi:Ntn hydrolase family protein [Natronobacterium lacisalsi]|uniref:hypothetical protein n=1 Tax=Natronobacterium lacisalsi TaxID=229731 RepID=UPI0012684714|nr:hypothetical protein [Halobiforma lacisalsi]
MTVGIGVISTGGDTEQAVIAADRLVTTGHTNRVEFEHTQSKIEEILCTSRVTSMIAASGSLSLADDVIYKLQSGLAEDPPESVRDVADETVKAFQKMERETINNQILSPLDISLQDLKSDDTHLSEQIEAQLLEAIYNKKEEIEQQLTLLLCGIDEDGPHIFSIQGADKARHDQIGYHTIGSGSQSAQLTFTRSQYDLNCSLSNALLTTYEAKRRAEEAQGVGRNLDIAVIREGEYEELDSSELQNLKEMLSTIREEKSDTRQNTIDQESIFDDQGSDQ